MAASRYTPYFVAGGVGILGGLYIWKEPLERETGRLPKPTSSQGPGTFQNPSKPQGSKDSSGPGNDSPLRHGGSQTNDLTPSNVAGSSAQATKSNSVDRDVKTQSSTPAHDGSGGGGVGLAEMRERKAEGKGLPSPQGGDSKAQPVGTVQQEGGGVKKPATGRWWLGGW